MLNDLRTPSLASRYSPENPENPENPETQNMASEVSETAKSDGSANLRLRDLSITAKI